MWRLTFADSNLSAPVFPPSPSPTVSSAASGGAVKAGPVSVCLGGSGATGNCTPTECSLHFDGAVLLRQRNTSSVGRWIVQPSGGARTHPC